MKYKTIAVKVNSNKQVNLVFKTMDVERTMDYPHYYPTNIRIKKGFSDNQGYASRITLYQVGNPDEDFINVEKIYGTFEEWENDFLSDGYPVTRKQLRTIHDVACSGWKSNIRGLAESMPSFQDQFNLPEGVVKEMFDAATTSQTEVLNNIFPTYKNHFSYKDLKIGDKVYLNTNSSQITGCTEPFYETESVEIIHMKKRKNFTLLVVLQGEWTTTIRMKEGDNNFITIKV